MIPPASPPVRIGIIGGGLMGREAASALARWFALIDFPVRAELTAVCDLQPERRHWLTQVPAVPFPPPNPPQPTPEFLSEDSPVRVKQGAAEWKRPRFERNGTWIETPRRAGLSSFGAGGANAHLLLAEFAEPCPIVSAPGPHLVLLSAQNMYRLLEYTQRLLAFLERRADSSVSIASLAYTLQLDSVALEDRLTILAYTEAELCVLLQQFLVGKVEREECPLYH